MRDKPAPYNIVSPEQLVTTALTAGKTLAGAQAYIAKMFQNPPAGVDPTAILLAGMQLRQVATPAVEPPTSTVKDDIMTGLGALDVSDTMLDSEVGEAPATFSAGGLVAFSEGGRGDKRAKKNAELHDTDEERVSKELDRVYGPTRKSMTGQKTNPTTRRSGVSNGESRAAFANRQTYNPRLGGTVTTPTAAKVAPVGLTALQTNAIPEDVTPVSEPLAIATGLSAPADMETEPFTTTKSASSGRGLSGITALNTDIEKETRLLRDTYDKLYPQTEAEKKNDEYYGEDQVTSRDEAQRKQDMWQSLMQLGFGAAASDSPYWTQAWGESGEKVSPQVAAMNKARKDEKAAAQKMRDAKAKAERARNEDEFKLATANVANAKELMLRAQLQQQENFTRMVMNSENIAASNRPKESDELISIWTADLMRQNPKMSEVEARAMAADKYWNYRSGQTKAQTTAFRTSYDKFMSQLIKNKDLDKGYRAALKQSPAAAQKYLQDQATALANAEVGGTSETGSGFTFLGAE